MFLREELSQDPQYRELTRREMDVLHCIRDGLPTKAISERLGLSRKGVEFHRLNIVRKWGCDNMMQVIRLALRQRLLEV
ncbi:MAG: LuxR C-terminal-related transcriptional regulator [Nitrospirales bacterium]